MEHKRRYQGNFQREDAGNEHKGMVGKTNQCSEGNIARKTEETKKNAIKTQRKLTFKGNREGQRLQSQRMEIVTPNKKAQDSGNLKVGSGMSHVGKENHIEQIMENEK